jgi:hypothetical protein
VRDLLPYLPERAFRSDAAWEIAIHGGLLVVPRRCGVAPRWFIMCPYCRRLVESLLRPPGVLAEDWACRACRGNPPYLSQRHGQRHPLRKRLRTARNHRTRQREAVRQLDRERSQRAGQAEAMKDDGRGRDVDRTIARVREAVLAQLADAKAKEDAVAVAIKKRLAAEQERSLERLQQLAAQGSAKRLRARAARSLERRPQQAQPSGASGQIVAKRPRNATLSPDTIERIRRVLSEGALSKD